MRAKFGCRSVTFHGDPDDATTPRTYELTAIYDTSTPENESFTKATPTGDLKMRVDNPNARFEVGENYYLDFTPTALAQHQKTPETMGNVHPEAGTYTREGGYRGADRMPFQPEKTTVRDLRPEPDRYGTPAAAYQPQHSGHPGEVYAASFSPTDQVAPGTPAALAAQDAAEAAQDAPSSSGYVIADAVPEKTEPSDSER